LRDLAALADLLPEMDPDAPLWEHLSREPFSWANVLKLLGWDPEGAACAGCGKPVVSSKLQVVSYYFFIPRQEFFCQNCVPKSYNDSFLLITNN
jgi:recombinational DNA repair protein (RecF pathway)